MAIMDYARRGKVDYGSGKIKFVPCSNYSIGIEGMSDGGSYLQMFMYMQENNMGMGMPISICFPYNLECEKM